MADQIGAGSLAAVPFKFLPTYEELAARVKSQTAENARLRAKLAEQTRLLELTETFLAFMEPDSRSDQIDNASLRAEAYAAETALRDAMDTRRALASKEVDRG